MSASTGLTEKRDLRTGTPVWRANGTPEIAAHELKNDLSVDVAIIGGGITGALLADALIEAGQSVAVFDRRGFVSGSTAASTALLQFEVDQPLIHLRSKIGEQNAARAYWRSASAIPYLRGRVEDLALNAEFTDRHALYLPGNVLDADDLKHEAEARRRIGLRSRFIARKEVKSLTGIDAECAIWSSGQGEINPVAFTASLWQSCALRGTKLFAPVEITDVEHHRDSVTLLTDDAVEVHAKHAVFATGYELAKIVPRAGHKITSTWAIATKAQANALWGTRCLIWEAADPYLYIRTSADGRVIVGGEDADFADEESRDALIEEKTMRIAEKLALALPSIDPTPEFRWAGCFGNSNTGLPSIGRIPGYAHCFAVLGFGGNGITFGAIAAQMLQRMILGLKDGDEDLFAF